MRNLKINLDNKRKSLIQRALKICEYVPKIK